MGRKTKRTPATVREILANIEAGLTYQDAAVAAGIAESTLYAWVQEFPEFSEALTGARARRTRRWLSHLNARAEAGDVRAIEALLDRCAPDYRKSSSIEASISLHASRANAPDMTVYTREELRSMAEIERTALKRLRGEPTREGRVRPMRKLEA